MGITTKDLAQICGVSRTTVHRALHGTGRIHPDTKEMILQAARENGYRPDLLARGLVKGQTSYIGVVVLDVKNRYFAQMLSSISAEANRRGYFVNITLHGNDRETERQQLTRLADYHMDGLIISSVNEGEEYREFLRDLEIPIVSVDNRIAEGIPFVGIDQEKAMQEVVHKIIEKKYRKVIFVCPPFNTAGERNIYVHRKRLEGFQKAAKQHPEIKTDCLLDWDYLEKADEAFSLSEKTAFACAADEFALEIMKRFKNKGKQAGRDYGIVGFDNLDILDYVTPRLTTISNSVEDVAVAAVNLLFDLIDKKQTARGGDEVADQNIQENVCITLPHTLIEGETI